MAVVEDDQPLVVPLAYARDGDTLLVHGSTGSRALRHLASGAPTCVTITVLDGYVLARAAVEASMRYRSAMLLGSFRALTTASAKTAALARISDHSVPGRWTHVRPPTRKELAGTAVLALGIAEWSLKVNQGWPTDEPGDLCWPVWAGVVPTRATLGSPLPAPDLAPGVAIPDHVTAIPAPGLQV